MAKPEKSLSHVPLKRSASSQQIQVMDGTSRKIPIPAAPWWKKNLGMGLLLFFSVVVVALSFRFLNFRRPGAPATESPPSPSRFAYFIKRADGAYEQGLTYQAIFFWERALQETALPEEKEQAREKLSNLYDRLHIDQPQPKEPSTSQPLLDVTTRPKLILQAESHYQEGRYDSARKLFYQFLAQSDALSQADHPWIAQAHFRIAQCAMLKAFPAQEKTSGFAQETLKILKK